MKRTEIPFPQSQKTRRIWPTSKARKNSYAAFTARFSADVRIPLHLQIACDSAYAVWLNGALAAFSGCGDYPWYKLYDSVALPAGGKGENELQIQVWYFGEDSQTYLTGEAGLAFELVQGNRVLLQSDRSILSAEMRSYLDDGKRITTQLGLSFCYDNRVQAQPEYHESIEFPMWSTVVSRGLAPMKLLARKSAQAWSLPDGYLIDLGEETVGFLDLELESSAEQALLISYGEHLADGRVPRCIGTRDFSVTVLAARGKNRYLNPFRRLAGRYLQLTCAQPVTLHYLGLRPVQREVTEKKNTLRSPLDRKIYDVCVNTLKNCMHEHYEDCPWREQAMYTMDSRNQMLCGYYAFEGSDFPRQMILLMAQGQRSDGLLSLCFPAGIDYPIPFFSLVYLKILEEYTAHTGDRAILQSAAPCVHRLMSAFSTRVDETGLIPAFEYPYWNFYEWSDASHHESDLTRTVDTPCEKRYDLILNAMYVHAAEICRRLYQTAPDTEAVRRAIERTFFVAERGLYRLSTDGVHFSVLGNSMVLLIGLGDEHLARRLLNDSGLIPVTLSMATFFYDALLRFGARFKNDILLDIRRKYGKMLEAGATTFWETEKGWQDFDGAGSLCHGWSAIPVYYLKILAEGEN